MRAVTLLVLLALSTGAMMAQGLPEVTFHGQPTLEQGISVEPYALFYQDSTGDTLQPLSFIAGQQFLPAARVPQIRYRINRAMPETSQVIWIQSK